MESYLLEHCKENILRILQDDNIEKHFSVDINFIELFENDTTLGNKLLKDPETALTELDNWVLHIQDLVLQELPEKRKLLFKQNVHARVYGLPACPELHKTVFPRNEDLETFLQITGTVVKTKDPRMLEFRRSYRCSKCKESQMVEADYDQKYVIVGPKCCSNPEGCQGKNLISVGGLSVENCKDYQEIKIQEQASNLNSTMPSSLWVTIEDDLVDLCKPGDDVTICGIVKRRWDPLVPGKIIDVELAFKANHIQVHNGNTVSTIITLETQEQFDTFWKKYEKSPLEGRDIILKSFCPKLYGMYLVKLAMALVLAGGSNKNGSGVQKRSESHILLVGDPGTGKSQLLRYSSKIIARSVLTTGVGTTSAGLTVAAVMEDGQWQLEAGALVLADGGICCIDEFNSMKPNDRASIHEAMEQQTISVAKAGIHCKLRTRCAILAATNPKGGHLDPSQSLSLNLAIPSPLLSRFDLVLMLKDAYKYEWDSKIATHILQGKNLKSNKVDESLWTLEMLQQYFIVVKSFNPPLSSEADRILAAYYQAQRQAFVRNKSRTTVRLLESLIRLSQGHAKLMHHREVCVMDAIFAIVIIESSMHGECAVLSLDSLNSLESFPDNPMKNYANLSGTILAKLGLNDLLDSEIEFLKKTFCLEPSLLNSAELNCSVICDIDGPKATSTQYDTTKVVSDVDNNEISNTPDKKFNNSNVLNSPSQTDMTNENNLKTATSNTSFPNDVNLNVRSSNTLIRSPVNENVKLTTCIDKKKRKRRDKADIGNMLHLLPSVNDDFDLDLVQNDGHRVEESQNTKTKKFHKKFKFKPKEKIRTNGLHQSEAAESEDKSEEVNNYNFDDCLNQSLGNQSECDTREHAQNKEQKKTETSNYYNFNFDNSENYHLENNAPKTENKEVLVAEPPKKSRIESLKSRFGFVPKNPPSNETCNDQLGNVEKENGFFNESIFENENQNLDFLNFDI